MSNVNLIMLGWIILFFISIVTMFLGGWLRRDDKKKGRKWVKYSSLFFSFIYFIVSLSIIVTDLISITKDVEIFFAFMLFGIGYFVLFLKLHMKYKNV